MLLVETLLFVMQHSEMRFKVVSGVFRGGPTTKFPAKNMVTQNTTTSGDHELLRLYKNVLVICEPLSLTLLLLRRSSTLKVYNQPADASEEYYNR